MSKADIIFRDMCVDILKNGTSDLNYRVRTKWDDGTPAHRIKKFGVMNQYDLREEFPAITFRKTAIKSAVDEILWIYSKKSNNIKLLNSHIWDQWADKDGSIGKAYGYQVAEPFIHHFDNNDKEAGCPIYLDQMDAVLYDLQNDPFSLRILTNLYNFSDLHEMNLYPCCYSCTFNVTDEGGDKLVLNMLLNQRSQDVLTANNWNVCQYAVLLMMIAQVSNMVPGRLVHMIADAHIYDRHVHAINELINRKTYNAPKVTIDPDITNFYHFTKDSVTVEDYNHGPQIENIPVAI